MAQLRHYQKKVLIKKTFLFKGFQVVWFEVMQNGIANYTKDVNIKNKTLYIKLSSPALKQELSYGKEKLIKIINQKFKKKIVNKIILN